MDLTRRIHEAIVASGKTRLAIAMEADTTMETLSRITTGRIVNPSVQVVARIAHACGTTVGALLGETPIELTAEDLAAMRRMRDWIDRKLAERAGQELVHDAGERELPRDFRRLGARLVVRVQGDSLRDLGILSGDLLYVAPAPPRRSSSLVVCRAGAALHVRRSLPDDGEGEVIGIVVGRSGAVPAP
jgi:transcriptional regulator with XRE-family HTH domain